MYFSLIIISSLLSGLIGVIVSNKYYHKNEIRRAKLQVFQQLLGNRHDLKGQSFTEALNKIFVEKEIKIDHIIDIQVPDEIIVERIIGRFSCIKCGATYHDRFKKTKVYGVCDCCDCTEFVRRIDDNRKTVKARLEQYRSLTFPVLPYYEKKSMLKCIDGTGSIEAVSEKIRGIIKYSAE